MAKYLSRISLGFLELGTNLLITENMGAPDRGKVTTYVDKVAAATVGKFCKETYSETILTGPTFHADGYYSDLNLELSKAGTGDDDTPAICSSDVVTLRFQDITTDVTLLDTAGKPINGVIDITNPLLIAIATAYYDTSGNNGYVVTGGTFVR